MEGYEQEHAETLKILHVFNSGIFSTEYTLKLLGVKGDISTADIQPQFHVDYGKNITIGSNFYANVGLTILDTTKVTIGNNVQCGPRVTISAAYHPTNSEERLTSDCLSKPVNIGNNVWLGAHSVILPGVTIGDNSVIGAGAVVTKDIPPNSVAVGVPATVIRTVGKQ